MYTSTAVFGRCGINLNYAEHINCVARIESTPHYRIQRVLFLFFNLGSYQGYLPVNFQEINGILTKTPLKLL